MKGEKLDEAIGT